VGVTVGCVYWGGGGFGKERVKEQWSSKEFGNRPHKRGHPSSTGTQKKSPTGRNVPPAGPRDSQERVMGRPKRRSVGLSATSQ